MQDAKILKSLYVFRGLSQLQLAQFNKVLEVRQVADGERVVQEGDQPDAMYVIQQGHFRVSKATSSGEQVLAELGSGEHFGEIGLIDHQPLRIAVPVAPDFGPRVVPADEGIILRHAAVLVQANDHAMMIGQILCRMRLAVPLGGNLAVANRDEQGAVSIKRQA